MTDETPPARLADDRLEELGLERQPFADNDFLYTDDDRDTRLNIAIGVLQSTPAMVLIAGGPGIGKSCFLRQLAAMDEGMVFAGVAATESMRLPEILQGIGAQGGETVVAAASRSVRETEGRLVLVVDDAERLPQQTIVQLAGLQAKLAERDQELPIVLACDRGQAAQLAEALEPSLAERSPLHEVALGPFGPAGTRAYVRSRIAQAGGDASLLLDDRAMDRIHSRSEGVPARINTEAARALSQPAGRSLAGLLALPAGAGRLAVIIGAPLIVTAAVAGWFLTGDETGERVVRNDDVPLPAKQDSRVDSGTAAPFKDETNAGADSGAVASVGGANSAQGAAPIQRETAAAAAGAEAAAPDNGNAGSDTVGDDAGAGAELAADAAPSQAPSPTRADEEAPPADGRTTATNGPAGDGPAADGHGDSTAAEAVNTATDTAAAPDGAAASEAVERTAQAEPGPMAEKQTTGKAGGETASTDIAEPEPTEPADESAADGWLAGRNGDHYTVQLLGAYKTATVERFLGQIDGETGRVHRVLTERDGRAWHVLVTGDYTNIEAARRAVDQLPSKWTENGAFPRSFASLKR